jgi:hypothetical protein
LFTFSGDLKRDFFTGLTPDEDLGLGFNEESDEMSSCRVDLRDFSNSRSYR